MAGTCCHSLCACCHAAGPARPNPAASHAELLLLLVPAPVDPAVETAARPLPLPLLPLLLPLRQLKRGDVFTAGRQPCILSVQAYVTSSSEMSANATQCCPPARAREAAEADS